MNNGLREYLAALSFENSDEAQSAVLEIALALESLPESGYTPSDDDRALYASAISNVELKALSADDVPGVITVLRSFAVADVCTLRSSIIWAIGKASPLAALPALLEIVETEPNRFDSQSLYQLCASLRYCLERFWRIDRHALRQVLQSHNPLQLLRSLVSSQDTKVAEAAEAALDLMQRLME